MFEVVYKYIELIKKNGYVYVSILGAIFVAFGLSFPANLLWSISNPSIAYHNYKIGEIAQAQLFGVFTVIAWFGVGMSLLRG